MLTDRYKYYLFNEYSLIYLNLSIYKFVILRL